MIFLLLEGVTDGVIGGYFTSVERAGFATMISLTRSLVALVASLMLLTSVFGGEGIWWSPILAEGICLLLTGGMLYWYWNRVLKKSEKYVPALEENFL